MIESGSAPECLLYQTIFRLDVETESKMKQHEGTYIDLSAGRLHLIRAVQRLHNSQTVRSDL
jgi:hypothetical protein